MCNKAIKTYKFGYEVDNPSFRFLKHRIFNEPDSGSLQETFYTLNLDYAKSFFAKNLKNYCEEYGFEEIESLFKKVTQNLMFNLYEIGDDFDVFVAFETMNNRGKKLSSLELLKNRLIYLTTLFEEDELKVDDRKALRGKINDAWKEVYYQLGRNKNNPLNDDDFLFNHWIMYFQYTRQKGDAYIRFLLEKKFTPQNIYSKTAIKLDSIQNFEEVREDTLEPEEFEETAASESKTVMRSKLLPKEIEDYVNSLKSAAVHWYNTYNPVNNSDLTDDESLWIDRLNRVGIKYFRPLVTVSFLAQTFDSEQRIKLFSAIERFIFIVFQMGRAKGNSQSFEFYRASKQVREGNLSVEDLMEQFNNSLSLYFDKDEESGKKYLKTNDFYNYLLKEFQKEKGFYGWGDGGLRYFLYEYEMAKVRKRGSQKIDWELFVNGSEKDKVSIEHIYPQTPNQKCWKDSFKGIKKKNLEYLKGTLGNLVPLSQSINSSLQNDCFEDKKSPKYNDRKEKIRQGYKDGSHSEIEVAGYDDWNAETIKHRGLKLLSFMEKRWDLKFKNEAAKVELLFLDFLDEDAEQ